MKYKLLYCCLILIMGMGCQQDRSIDQLKAEHHQWKQNRLDRLKEPTGWLNLAGLYWLEAGENSLGSDSINSIVFPEKAPDFIGTLTLTDSTLMFTNALGKSLTVNDNPIEKTTLTPDASGNPDQVKHGDFGWYIIKRGDQYGIRLRDYDSPLIEKLDSIPAYPFSTEWIMEADFVPLDSPMAVTVPTIIGVDEEYTANGMLEFSVKGEKYTLFPFESGNGLFIIFGDETSAVETYGAGRFLYTEKPNWRNKVTIDFNRAYNPPCAFTPYATCPLPPGANILDLAVRAGEKDVHLYEH